MTGLNLGQNILSAEAGASVGDVGGVQAQASLDFLGAAELKRGVQLELGVSAMAEIEAAFAKFLAADAEVRGQARAQLRGQVQAPIDLFSEAGVAVRLQAVAQIALSARLAVGLSLGDFIALARQDPRIRGVYLRLLEIFLEEINVQAGVQGKVAYSAMAYLNLVVSGRLIDDELNGLPAGFTIAANCGAGLKGGGGWGLFAQLGFSNPRRFLRRSVDVMVDETVLRLQRRMDSAAAREQMKLLRAPAKMALRGGFELGLALAENSSALSNAGPQLAQRCTQVVLEEAQRILLEQLTELAITLIREGLEGIGAGAAAWDASGDERAFLQQQLGDMPDDPLEPRVENIDYWMGVINASVGLGIELSGALFPDELRRATGLLWSSLQLVFIATQRVSDATVRASFFGTLSAEERIEAFRGQVIDQAPAPQVVQSYINEQLGRDSDEELRQEHLVTFLTGEAIDELIDRYPSTRALLEIVAGADASPAALSAAASVILDNAGAFVPTGAGSEMDPEASLRALSEGLQAYIDTRVQLEVIPQIYATIGNNDDLRLYVDEVLLPSMDFIVATAFDGVLDWSFGNLSGADALREACSSIVMKVLGRSLVVTTDVLMTHASRAAGAELRTLAGSVEDPGGMGEQLADAAGADRELVGEVLRETLTICAEVFGPLPEPRRAKIRNLLYMIMDSVPPEPDADWVDQLQRDAFIPDAQTREALLDLGNELGSTLAGYVQDFYLRVLQRVGEVVLEEIQEFGEQLAGDVRAYIAQLKSLLNALAARLAALPALIAAQLAAVNEAITASIMSTRTFIEALPAALEAGLRDRLAAEVYDRFLGTLLGSNEYLLLPAQAAQTALEALTEGCYDLASASLVDPIAQHLGDFAAQIGDAIVAEIQAALEEHRAAGTEVEPAAVARDIFFERIDAALAEVFGDAAPELELDISFSYTTPAAGFPGTPLYVPAQTVSVYIPLGNVALPLPQIGTLLREALSSLALVDDWVTATVGNFLDAFDAQEAHQALSLEQDLAQQQRLRVEADLADFEGGATSARVLSPQPGAIFGESVDVDVHIRNATPAHLGLDASTQERVVVLLNHEPLAIERFDIDIVETDDPDYEDAGDLALAMTGTALTDRTTEYLKARAMRGEIGGSPDGSDAAFAGLRRVSTNAGTRASIATVNRGAATDRRDPASRRRVAKDQRRAAREGPGFASTRAPDDAGARGTAFRHRALHTIGTNGRRRERDDDALTLGCGLRMTLRLAGSECRPGINTLALIVSDGFGHTENQVVSFVVAPADPPPDRSGMVKGRTPWAFTRLPGEIVALMNLERDLERAVGKRGASPAVGTGTDSGTRGSDDTAGGVTEAFWIEGRSRRRKALVTARDVARRQSDRRRAAFEESTRLVASGGLRPEPLRPEINRSPPASVASRNRSARFDTRSERGGEEKQP